MICESGAGQHFSATAAVAAKFNMPLIGVMGKTDIARVNQNVVKAKHYGAKLKAVPGSLKEAITFAITFFRSSAKVLGSSFELPHGTQILPKSLKKASQKGPWSVPRPSQEAT